MFLSSFVQTIVINTAWTLQSLQVGRLLRSKDFENFSANDILRCIRSHWPTSRGFKHATCQSVCYCPYTNSVPSTEWVRSQYWRFHVFLIQIFINSYLKSRPLRSLKYSDASQCCNVAGDLHFTAVIS
jgi:hypothetical protein